MKTLYSKSLSTLLLLFLCSVCSFATTTWIGGQSVWNDASNWDTGTIPSLTDDVLIPAGSYPRIYSGVATAASLVIESNARLMIYNNTTLDGIENNGYAYVLSSGVLYMKYIDGTGINNMTSGYFNNRGHIEINDMQGSTIKNRDRFYNYGEIYTTNSGPMINWDYFYNSSSAIIDSQNCSGTALTSTSTFGLSNFRNYGSININNAGVIGISFDGNFTNYSTGEILVSNVGNSSFYFNDQANVKNYGHMKSDSPHWAGGFMAGGVLENHDLLELYYSNNSAGLTMIYDAHFYNYGEAYLKSNTNLDFSMGSSGTEAFVTNASGAKLEFSRGIVTYNNSLFANDGFLFSFGTNYMSTDNIENNGVLHDPNSTISTAIDNQQVVVRPFTGTLTVGTPYANALDLGALDNVTINGWHIGSSSNSPVAGTYDDANNTFTPNNNAVGRNFLFVYKAISILSMEAMKPHLLRKIQ